MADLLRCTLFSALTSVVYAFLVPIPIVQKFRSNGILSLRLSGSTEQEFANVAAVHMPKNVLGGTIQCCCVEPKTGFYRDGFCTTGSINLFRTQVLFLFVAETKSSSFASIVYISQVQKTLDSTSFAHRYQFDSSRSFFVVPQN
jgi:hypothetical protein